MEQVELSFVIPAYNEEDFIEDTLGALDEAVKNRKLPYEIVVVNDGSVDETLANAARYARKNMHVKVVSYAKNMGKGYAVKAGFMETVGEIIVFADSDMDIDLSTVASYIDALENGDIVIASKWHQDSVVDIPFVRRVLSRSFNVLVRLFTGAKLGDTQVGLKAMRKSAFLDVFPRLSVKRYAFDVELMVVSNLFGLRIVEMPTSLKIKTGYFSPVDVWRMFVDLLGIAYRLRVLHWYGRRRM